MFPLTLTVRLLGFTIFQANFLDYQSFSENPRVLKKFQILIS